MVTPVTAADSTVKQIRTLVRRLTASPSESFLATSVIDKGINTFITQDFAYAIKLDQMRTTYVLYTSPYVERYPININEYQGIRDPMFVEGVRGLFFKDKGSFYAMWPRLPTKYIPAYGDGVTTSFSFSVGAAPILPTQVVLGTIDVNGAVFRVVDDGGGLAPYGNRTTTGNLLLLNSDSTGQFDPRIPNTYPIPNSSLPNPPYTNVIGSVNYVTGQFTLNFPTAPASGTEINLWVSQYQQGRPYCMLYWQSEIFIRPVPDNIYRIEVDAYQTPVQFLLSNEVPLISQWYQYIGYGVACEILRQRNDFVAVASLMEGFKRQEALVLERQAIEEIGQANITIYNSPAQSNYNYPNYWGYS